jgi:hypothetical protein
MKKLVLIAGAAAAISAAAAVTPANAGFKGCCGGWTGGGWGGGYHHHWHGGFGLGVIDAGYGVGGGDCYYTRRTVLVPGIGLVSKKQLVCE